MDFSERGIIKKQHEIKSTTKRLATKTKVTGLRFAVLAVAAIAVIGCMAAWGVFCALVDRAGNISAEAGQLAYADSSSYPLGSGGGYAAGSITKYVPGTIATKLQKALSDIDGDINYKTYIYYSDGTLSDTLIGQEANREYVFIEEIPRHVQLAFVAMEDERFYEHKGIDIRGIFRAAYSVLATSSLDYGASTITQQVLKNLVFGGGDETNNFDLISRKIQEQYLAVQLENEVSKDLILEYYLNIINLGSGSWGVQTAAQTYFGKDVWDLTLSEAAVLAPIAYSPTFQNPFRYPEDNARRRMDCLNLMLKAGFCTQEEYAAAVTDDVYSRLLVRNTETNVVTKPYSYFTDELISQVINDLMTEFGMTEADASRMLYTGGLSIFTTQERDIQEILDRAYTDEANFPAPGEGSYYEFEYKVSVYKENGDLIHYQMSDLVDYYADFVDYGGLYHHTSANERITSGGKTYYKGITSLGIDRDDINAKCDAFKDYVTEEGDTAVESRIITLQPQSSMFIMEQATGKVVALYGGRGTKDASLVLNRATDTVRQVGSTYKVLASFLPALDTAGMTLATVFDDSRYFYPDSEKEVINWYSTGFLGLQSIRTGIYRSLNIVAVKALEKVTPRISFEYLQNLGFTTLVASQTVGTQSFSDIGLPLALGGLTRGVSNEEMTAAYASIANGGVYQEPIYYTKILDRDGSVLIDKSSRPKQVMKASTAWLLTDAMEDTTTIGTGTRLAFKNYKMPVAGKTGTATDDNDLWFVGYTPYYTAGIWTGFDNNLKQTNKTYHQNIWRNVMEEIHSSRQLTYTTFEMPDSIVTADICTKCGKLAIAGVCDNALSGDCIKTEYFAKGTMPMEKCDCHVAVSICEKTGSIATPNCPTDSVKTYVYLKKTENPDLPSTQDTPYILPEALSSCTTHSAPVVTPDLSGVTDGSSASLTREPMPDLSSLISNQFLIPPVPTPTPMPD